MIGAELLVSAFVAGFLTILAPCTLPLVPAYLSFISGVSLADLKDPLAAPRIRRRIFLNGLLYVLGFSLVWIALGSLLGLGGTLLVQYRPIVARLGGIVVLLFGLSMLKILRLPALAGARGRRLPVLGALRPGHPVSSLLFGSAFALGWTPCVGPVLGAILTLAAVKATVLQGTILLAVFSAGLAVPFLLLAGGIGSGSRVIARFAPHLRWVERLGGMLLLFLGALLLTDNFGAWIATAYRWLGFVNYDRLLDYL